MRLFQFVAVAAAPVLLAASSVAAQTSASAATSPSKWYIHVSPLSVDFDAKAKIALGGAVVPGASATASDNVSAGIELGYRFNPNVSASLTVGLPPTTTLKGTGPLAGVELGKVMYGPAVLAAQYHFTNFGPKFEPYLGAGVNYTLVLDAKDGAVTNLKVDSPVGSVAQAGIESRMNDRWSLFVDVKKIFVKTKAKGFVGPAPAEATVTLNPTIVSAGVSYQF